MGFGYNSLKHLHLTKMSQNPFFLYKSLLEATNIFQNSNLNEKIFNFCERDDTKKNTFLSNNQREVFHLWKDKSDEYSNVKL